MFKENNWISISFNQYMIKRLALYQIFIVAFFVLLCSCEVEEVERDEIEKELLVRKYSIFQYYKLKKINELKRAPLAGDWLESHDTKHQSFAEYIGTDPVCACSSRRKIYVLPIGEFNSREDSAINFMMEYMGAFFGLEVVRFETISDSIIPEDARRDKTEWEWEQLNSSYLIHKVLPGMLPGDGAVLLGVTQKDLYPSDDRFAVQGQASLRGRVGVMTISRLKQDYNYFPDYSKLDERVMGTSCHETLHMFTIPHCTEYNCMMNGSSHLMEADSKPLHLCPDCLAKLIYSLQDDVIDRYDRLIAFYEKYGFKEEKWFCEDAKEVFLECE